MSKAAPPVILSLSALDPSGCAGLQADIETAASLGCHCAPIATALCSSGSVECSEVIAVDPPLIIEQARSVLEDMPVQAIKLGFPGSVAIVEAVSAILQDYPHLTVVLHPAFCLRDDTDAQQAQLPEAMLDLWMPRVDIAVLTQQELQTFARSGDTVAARAQALVESGLKHLLVASHDPARRRWSTGLYGQSGLQQQYTWQQTTPTCHGSSSTLCSAIAAFRAHDFPLQAAVEQAQNYTWQTMAAARQMGFGKPTPHRFFWADEEVDEPGTMPGGNPVH